MYIDWKALKIFCIGVPILLLIAGILGAIGGGLIWLVMKLFSYLPPIDPAILGWLWIAVFVFFLLCSFNVIRFGKKPKK